MALTAALLLGPGGCMAVHLPAPAHDPGAVTVVDRRVADDRRSFRPNGFLAPIIQIGDDELKPAAPDLLAAALQERLPPSSSRVTLSIESLRVFDSFPRRANRVLSSGMAGGLAGAGLPLTVFASAPPATDSIVVWAKGSVDDVPFEESVSVPYSEPMTAIALRQTAEFQGAIVEAFRVLGERIHGRIAARR